jgi:hypothetical protein
MSMFMALAELAYLLCLSVSTGKMRRRLSERCSEYANDLEYKAGL